jgi:ornithine cyclodeaminase
MPQRFRLLTEAHVTALLPLSDLIASMETALARFSAGEVLQPVRSVLSVGPTKAYYGLMPAYVADPPQLGAKIVTVFGENHRRGLPSHLATIFLLDPDTGALIALMDGRYITEARTAAVSAVSARHMARPDAATLAILGTGVQARSHLEALAAVRPIRQVRVWSPTPASRERFVAEMSGHVPATLTAAASAEAAVREADIVVLVTSSPTPVIDAAWVASGAHVIAVGACRPEQREMDPALVASGRLVVDSRAAALVESGDVVLGIAEGRFDASHIAGELGDVVRGALPGRTSPGEITIFKSLGMAVEDVAAADLVYRRALETGAGTQLEL